MNKQNKEVKYKFNMVEDISEVDFLIAEWRKSLTAPQDDMWETFTDDYATKWGIVKDDELIGYASVNEENRLLQFYVIHKWMDKGNQIFEQFIFVQKITEAIVGTNNPYYLSIAMHYQKAISIHYYQFQHFIETKLDEKEGVIRLGKLDELEKFVEFCHVATGGPKEWLSGYLSTWIERRGYFVFENEGEILGTMEVRKSKTVPNIAHLGMIVSPNHRKKGLGTFLLGKAKEIALDWNMKPVCGCDYDNVGSIKSINNNGFRSINQMLLVKLDR